jgi:hypothetical protein
MYAALAWFFGIPLTLKSSTLPCVSLGKFGGSAVTLVIMHNPPIVSTFEGSFDSNTLGMRGGHTSQCGPSFKLTRGRRLNHIRVLPSILLRLFPRVHPNTQIPYSTALSAYPNAI